MKKIFLLILAIISVMTSQAKVVRILYSDGKQECYSSSQLGSIDFLKNGTVVITDYRGMVLSRRTNAIFESVIVDDSEVITDVTPLEIECPYIGQLPTFSRHVTRYNFLYPSHDPHGDPITLSGSIIIPQNILEGRDPSRGILLMQHYTVTQRDEIPTRGYNPTTCIMLANPMTPDYIVIESDFYGFGCSERFTQAYCCGVANGQASLDALNAGRRLLERMYVDYGELIFNIGYSGGAYDAIATLRAAQTLPGYEDIHFAKTFAGGGPYDLAEGYRDYVRRDSVFYLVVLPLLVSSLYENGLLDYTYNQLFTSRIAAGIPRWVLTKQYGSWDICDSIGHSTRISDMLRAPYHDLGSDASIGLAETFSQFSSMAPGWTPDPSERIYLFHAKNDEYVSPRITENLAQFLEANGYTRGSQFSDANLQIGTTVTSQGHVVSIADFALHVIPCIKNWETLHSNKPALSEQEYFEICKKWLEH